MKKNLIHLKIERENVLDLLFEQKNILFIQQHRNYTGYLVFDVFLLFYSLEAKDSFLRLLAVILPLDKISK